MGRYYALAAGSLAGGFARFWLSGAVYGRWGAEFPHGTLLVNLSGCLLIGLFHGLAESKALLSPEARLLLMGGFCGAFTTFSTFMMETSDMLRAGQPLKALAYVGISLLAGFALFHAGSLLGGLSR